MAKKTFESALSKLEKITEELELALKQEQRERLNEIVQRINAHVGERA